MERETVVLDERAQQRLLILNHILAGELSALEAAGYLGLSLRSVRRLLARYRSDEGAAGAGPRQPRSTAQQSHPRGAP